MMFTGKLVTNSSRGTMAFSFGCLFRSFDFVAQLATQLAPMLGTLASMAAGVLNVVAVAVAVAMVVAVGVWAVLVLVLGSGLRVSIRIVRDASAMSRCTLQPQARALCQHWKLQLWWLNFRGAMVHRWEQR